MEHIQHIFYINLDHRTDRLEHIESQLSNLGVLDKSERFRAIKTTSGAVGCTMSHIKCLQLAIERKYENIFICEDDITFLDIPTFTKSLKYFFNQKKLKQWDVLVAGGNNAPPFEQVSEYYAKIHNCQSTTGYIVNKHYFLSLLNNFKEGLAFLLRDPTNKISFAIDVYWKQLQFRDNWYLILPLTVVQIESYSDIEERFVDYKNLMLDFDKKRMIQIFNA